MKAFAVRLTWAVLISASALVSCAEEDHPGVTLQAVPGAPSSSALPSAPDASLDVSTDVATDALKGDVSAPSTDAPRVDVAIASKCAPLMPSTEQVPARSSVMSATTAEPVDITMFVRDLYDSFKSNCGACHVEASLGSFHVAVGTFSQDMRDAVLDRIFSDDPMKVMPPGALPASQRKPSTDPYLKLGELLRLWYAQGKPSDIFVTGRTDPTADAGTGADYLLTPTVGKALTNLGNCIPDKTAIGTVSDDLDAAFAKMARQPPGQGTIIDRIGLPAQLGQTDLISFDSEVLAKHGVVAFAPAYTLWADSARKIRYVRVPKGQSIKFNKATQQFDIPENTRFYKTFLKRVVEKDGSEHYRKVETRLIVVRNSVLKSDGTYEQKALFGSYAWNAEETDATLVTDPLRNGEPFRDRLLTLVTDEGKYQKIVDDGAGDAGFDLQFALQKAGVTRRYAIPGSERCIQCHMGAVNQSFVLGFTPLQINRRPIGQGGVIETPSDDELNQFQRLIDYGVITGVDKMSDVLPLENTQGDRAPRNEYELRAQGYMVGNCAHCHNPRGFPSVANPILADVLNFMPSPTGGVFQFSLEKFSPRIARDIGGSVQIPYITPSLMDYPGQGDYNHMAEHGDPSATVPFDSANFVLAPWRSLIYRNVDTPFAYSDDLALFPHMPVNTPGFDCRLPRIMGDWMVSIPARRKHPDVPETKVQSFKSNAGDTYTTDYPVGININDGTDTEAQPYVEVKPTDGDYAQAKAQASKRMLAYHSGGTQGIGSGLRDYARYNYCPDTSDVVDPYSTGVDQQHLVPRDLRQFSVNGELVYSPAVFTSTNQLQDPYTEDGKRVPASASLIWPDEGVPDRPHWVVTDLTDTPGAWIPRRSDWKTELIDHKFTSSNSDDEKKIVEILSPSDPSVPGVSLTKAMTDYGSQAIPMGLWKKKDECNAKFASIRKLSSYSGAEHAKWMDVATATSTGGTATGSDPVYSELPGAVVYNMVCINCHGPQADGLGRQADTLQLMTGGEARVANFRNGLFGPASNPGANRAAEFSVGGVNQQGGAALTPDDWAARYLSWMALGGTTKLIPKSILNVVATTPMFGVPRKIVANSANMLSAAQRLCGLLLQYDASTAANVDPTLPPAGGNSQWGNLAWDGVVRKNKGALMTDNGDAELWARLCSMDNPPPIAAIQTELLGEYKVTYHLASRYPQDAPLGNDRGQVETGLSATNTTPWCVRAAEDALGGPPQPLEQRKAYIDGFRTVDGKPLPICPKALYVGGKIGAEDYKRWANRGAINAGLAVYLYVSQLTKNGLTPVPPYDHCEQLP